MAKMPDKYIDLINADAPYGENQADWDKEKPNEVIWSEMFRVLKVGGVCYYWGFWGHADWVLRNARQAGFFPQSRIVWWFRTGRPEKKSYREDTEECWYFSKGEPKTFNPELFLEPYEDENNYERYGRKGKHPGTVWIESRIFHNHPENVGHETQKPEKLIEKIILISSNEGDLIYDPFIGSGTTAVMAEKHKRLWIGSENKPANILMAEKRICEKTKQGNLLYAV